MAEAEDELGVATLGVRSNDQRQVSETAIPGLGSADYFCRGRTLRRLVDGTPGDDDADPLICCCCFTTYRVRAWIVVIIARIIRYVSSLSLDTG